MAAQATSIKPHPYQGPPSQHPTGTRQDPDVPKQSHPLLSGHLSDVKAQSQGAHQAPTPTGLQEEMPELTSKIRPALPSGTAVAQRALWPLQPQPRSCAGHLHN